MNIDFIKWMVSYAYDYILSADKIYYEGCYFGNPLRLWDQKLHRHNLLQETIEGINDKILNRKSDEDFALGIVQNPASMEVYKPFGSLLKVYAIDGNRDKAKEEALKYIWEQEKSNG